MPAGTLAHPEPNRAVNAIAQFVNNQARRTCVIHKHAHLRPLDDDTDVKPFVAVGLRHHRLLVFAELLRSENLPAPTWIGDILDSVTVALRVRRPKVEWPEVQSIVRLCIDCPKRDADKAIKLPRTG
jgi:hypothetical protein